MVFPGVRLHPTPFRKRHYHFLSVPHAARKPVGRPYDPAEVARGWHGWRAHLRADMLRLPSQTELRECDGDDDALDASNPRTQHYLGDLVSAYRAAAPTQDPPALARVVPAHLHSRLRGQLRRLLRRA